MASLIQITNFHKRFSNSHLNLWEITLCFLFVGHCHMRKMGHITVAFGMLFHILITFSLELSVGVKEAQPI